MTQGVARVYCQISHYSPPVPEGGSGKYIDRCIIFMDDACIRIGSLDYPFQYRGHKSLKMLPDSISEGIIFQNFLRGMPPDPLDLACFTCMYALHTCTISMYFIIGLKSIIFAYIIFA